MKRLSLSSVTHSFLILGFLITGISCPNSLTSKKNTSSENGWMNLFNGKDLSGWKELEGKTKFGVKNGQIIGTTIPDNPNSVLCTNRNYSNLYLSWM